MTIRLIRCLATTTTFLSCVLFAVNNLYQASISLSGQLILFGQKRIKSSDYVKNHNSIMSPKRCAWDISRILRQCFLIQAFARCQQLNFPRDAQFMCNDDATLTTVCFKNDPIVSVQVPMIFKQTDACRRLEPCVRYCYDAQSCTDSASAPSNKYVYVAGFYWKRLTSSDNRAKYDPAWIFQTAFAYSKLILHCCALKSTRLRNCKWQANADLSCGNNSPLNDLQNFEMPSLVRNINEQQTEICEYESIPLLSRRHARTVCPRDSRRNAFSSEIFEESPINQNTLDQQQLQNSNNQQPADSTSQQFSNNDVSGVEAPESIQSVPNTAADIAEVGSATGQALAPIAGETTSGSASGLAGAALASNSGVAATASVAAATAAAIASSPIQSSSTGVQPTALPASHIPTMSSSFGANTATPPVGGTTSKSFRCSFSKTQLCGSGCSSGVPKVCGASCGSGPICGFACSADPSAICGSGCGTGKICGTVSGIPFCGSGIVCGTGTAPLPSTGKRRKRNDISFRLYQPLTFRGSSPRYDSFVT